MSKHTKGPWTTEDIDQSDFYRYVVGENKIVCRVKLKNFMGNKREHAEADARLIAAAPLMLEALRTTRECLEQANAAGLIADTLWAGDCETLFDHIDAAIAAATGAQGGES